MVLMLCDLPKMTLLMEDRAGPKSTLLLEQA